MIEDIQELNFPSKDGVQYATLSQATVNLQDMAECTITTQIKIADDIAPDFSYDWAIAFKGHKFIFPLRTTTSSIESSSMLSNVEITFQHWAIYQLKSKMFFSVPNYQAEAVFPDKYIDTVSLNLDDFVKYYAMTLNYYFGDKITIDLNPDWVSADEPTVVEINYSKLWDILIKFYELFAVRWQIEPNGDIEHYVIKVGYDTQEVSHIFEYGFEGGLLKFQQQVQDENIANMLLGRGSSENLPYRYFKNQDPNNPTFAADPDWIPELKDVYFAELRGATFRSYIQGWRAKHVSQYRKDYPDEDWTLTITDAQQAYAPWAFEKGYTDEKFDPVEYVKDDESILRYGEILSGLENNEEIKPTIQGMTDDELGRLDETVKIGEVTDIPEEKPISDAQVSDAPVTTSIVRSVPKSEYKKHTYECSYFGVSQGKYADLIISPVVQNVYYNGKKQSNPTQLAEIKAGSINVIVVNAVTGEEHSASGIPEGTWSYRVTCEVHNMDDKRTLDIEIGDNYPKLIEASPIEEYTNTWEIWIKNIWGTSIQRGESPIEYAERVWRPILGDHLGEEAKIIFTDGMLAMSEDYEFTIVKIPDYDTSVLNEIRDENGNLIVREPISHWKLTLAKCDADLEATGLYVPSTKRFAVKGNHIAFIGIDVPHKYVTEAEKRLDNWKTDELDKVKNITPPITVQVDKVRVHNYGNEGALVDSLKIGNSIRVADKRFLLKADGTPMAYKKLYLQSITYTYNEATDKEANIIPDIEITLGEEYNNSGSVVSQITSDINALQRQVGSISNVAQIVRNIGDARYLRKDMSDKASAPIEFAQGLDSQKSSYMRDGVQFGQSFAEGQTGFGGKIDKYGDAWLGGLHLRSFLEVPELRYNRTEISIGNDWNAPGGGIIEQVSPDYNDDGSLSNTGVITLKLEDGEIGAVAVDDLCSGIFHDGKTQANNAVADSDDGIGNFHFAGFCTVYFRITEILDTNRNSAFRYELRPISQKWTQQYHPSAQMHFVGYGNKTNKQRQTSRYATRTYERYLRNVNDWEFGEYNIAAQFGDLSNLTIQGIAMSNYSAYLNNIYMTGRIEQLDLSLRMSVDYGDYNFIKTSEIRIITCAVYRGFEDLTSKITSWEVTRSSRDILADNNWNTSSKATRFNGVIAIDYSDLGSDPEKGATFTFKATMGDETATSSVVFRREPIDGTNGTNGTDGKDGKDGIYSQNLLNGSEFPVSDRWTFFSNVAIDETHKFQGRNSVKNNQSGNTDNPYRGIKQTFTGKLSVGEVYTLSMWSYCEDLSTFDSVVNLELQVFDADNNRLATGYVDNKPTEVNKWQQFKASVTIPENAASMLMHAYVRNNGIIWYSSPKLERGENPNPVWTPNPNDRIPTPTEQFYVSTSNILLFGGSWTETRPTLIDDNKFLWSRVKLTYGDGTIEYTEPMCQKGDKGDKGDKGNDGAQGIQGCIYRVTQWQADKEYRNDTELTTDGIRYIDVVLIPAPLLATKAYAFMCAKTHTSSAENAPDTSADTEYWTKMNSFAPIYTPFLLADGAAITLLQSNRIYVMKDDGTTVNVGMGGGNYPLWIGANSHENANFKVDADGKATLTEAEISGKVTSGDANGQRVELQPDNKAMKIYDESGSEVASFEGNTYTDNSQLISSDSGTVSILTRTEYKYGYNAGVTLGRGSITHTGTHGMLVTLDEVNISEAVQTQAPVQFNVSGYLYTKYIENVSSSNPSVPIDTSVPIDPSEPIKPVPEYSIAKATLLLNTYSDAGLTDLIGSQIVTQWQNKDGGFAFSNKNIKTTTGGYHVLRLKIRMESFGALSATIQWGGGVSNKPDISATYSSDFYSSKYFANGLCLGQSLNDYVMAYNQGLADGMRFVAESRNFGLDVSNSGIKYRHHTGGFTSMPLLVMKGVYTYNSSEKIYVQKDAAMRSYNGIYPNITRESMGKIKFTIPSSWKADMPDYVNQFIVRITGFDTFPIKGSIETLTSTALTILLSDDDTLNDGGFMIEIYWMQ